MDFDLVDFVKILWKFEIFNTCDDKSEVINETRVSLPFDERPDCGMCHDDGDEAQFPTGFNAGGLVG